MYQIKLSVNKERMHWLDSRFGALEERVREARGIIAKIDRYGRIIVAVACENEQKEAIQGLLLRFLTDLYVTTAKEDFFRERLRFHAGDDVSVRMLYHALAVFDRERDREFVKSRLVLSEDFSIDGFYTFKLSELKKRWAEVGGMTEDNISLLYDEEALDLLLRFLLSAVNPKCDTVSIAEDAAGRYRIKLGEAADTLTAFDAADLLLGLIDIAPVEVFLENPLSDLRLNGKIRSLFDVKEPDVSTFGENY